MKRFSFSFIDFSSYLSQETSEVTLTVFEQAATCHLSNHLKVDASRKVPCQGT